MGGKGSADSSGMAEALISAQAAQQEYQLGEQQLQWTQNVWNADQPMVQQIEAGDIAAQGIANQYAGEQSNLYQSTYAPLQQEYVNQATNWATAAQQTVNAAAAEANQNEAANSQLQSSMEQLESYGINPGATRFAGLDIGAKTSAAAAAAGAGTESVQQTKLQGLGLESGAINTGMGLANNTASLTGAGTGAGSAGSGAVQSNLSTGASAQTEAVNWYNSGAANMNTYVNAVNGYNQAQLGYSELGASSLSGIGSAVGGLVGLLAEGGPTDPNTMRPAPSGAIPTAPPRGGGANSPTPGVMANSPSTLPPGATPGGAIPTHASPSGGREVDDVPARLTVGEFVMPKDVVAWEGQKAYYKQIDKSRQEKMQAEGRTDIGGQRGSAIPTQPTFSSRPQAAQGQGAIPIRSAA